MTLIKGDGIGPEISEAVIKIFDAAQVSGHSDVHKFIFMLTCSILLGANQLGAG